MTTCATCAPIDRGLFAQSADKGKNTHTVDNLLRKGQYPPQFFSYLS